MTDEQAVNKLILESASFRLDREGSKALAMAIDALRMRNKVYPEAFSKGYGIGYDKGYEDGYSAAEQEEDDGR